MRPRFALTLATLLAVASAMWLGVARASADEAHALASALERDSVQIVGASRSAFSAVSTAKANSLQAEIALRDPGRIWIAFVSPRSQSSLSDLADTVFGVLPAGTLIMVADDRQDAGTTHFWVGSTWEASDAAQNRLNGIINGYHKGQGPLSEDLKLSIYSFARADAAAGHPALNSPGTSTQQATTPASGSGGGGGNQAGTGAPAGTSTQGGGGGGNGGLIAGIIAGAVLLLIAAIPVTRSIRSSMRTSHWHKEQTADVHADANSDFVKLGEAIEALDIDSSMPNASAAGKEEYSHAIGCYAEAERQLKQADDPYHFDRALAAIKAGHGHVQAADQLFNPGRHRGPSDETAVVERLERLTTLHDSGALTDAEFSEQKRKLLGD